MFKNKNEITKISNIFFLVMGGLSILSIISMLASGVDGIQEYSTNDYYFYLIMMIIYSIISLAIIYITNKKIKIYNDDFPVSRRAFNFFVMISIMSMVITLSANILNYVFYNNFSWHTLIVTIFGYIPAYIVSYYFVSKGELLKKENESKINVANFLIVYLLMQYYINIISILGQIVLNMGDIVSLISALCFSLIWISIIVIAYKLINKK